MKKVMVIGSPGSGKSVFSRALHTVAGLPLVHLDQLYWNADKTAVDNAVFLKRLQAVLQTDAWILDGNYASTMEMRMQACDTVVFLDYPPAVCLSGIRERIRKPLDDMPWVESDEDPELTAFVKNYPTGSRPQVMALLQAYAQKEVMMFTDRSEAEAFLAKIHPQDI